MAEYLIVDSLFVIAIIIFIVDMVRCFLKKTLLGRHLGFAIMASLIVVVSYFFNVRSSFDNVKEIACCVDHAAIVWTLYFLTMFVLDFENRTPRREFRFVSIGLIVVDSLLLLTNFKNHFVANIYFRNFTLGKVAFFQANSLFVFHSIICLSMLSTMLFILVRAVIRESAYYKLRYLLLLVVLGFLACSYLLYVFMLDIAIDFSRALYGLAVILVYTSTYRLAPSRLVKNMSDFVDDNISDATIIYDNKGDVLKINGRARSMFKPEVFGKIDSLKAVLNIGDEEHFVDVIDDSIFEISYKPVYDSHGKYVATTFIFHDITESRRQYEKVHKAAIHDPLTGCYNRTGFFEKAPEFLAVDSEKSGYVVMVSGINNFKGINGLYGTEIGDRVLLEISKKLHDFHHEFHMLYGRTAEGKFSCLLPFNFVDEVVNELSSFKLELGDETTLHVDMSHGFVIISDDTKTLDFYYEEALLALDRCKSRTDMSVVEYTAEMAKEQKKRDLVLTGIHDSIERGEFFILLQPQIDLKKNCVGGAEALVRWKHPELGVLSPAEFIPLFENNTFISRLDRFVWKSAAKLIKEFTEDGSYQGPISVNVSQIDIMCMDVVGELDEILKETGIPASKLHIEITESACAEKRGILVETLKQLREKGFVVEIDDFGSGYSSLNALMHIPFDSVKLDMDFMRREKREKQGDIIITAMADMLHNLNASIIVEGVETYENLKCANMINGDFAQGYYFSKPLAVDEFKAFVKNFGKK